jgi:uncharacterized RDD family membrane protein YckC
VNRHHCCCAARRLRIHVLVGGTAVADVLRQQAA